MYMVINRHNPYNSCGQIEEFKGLYRSEALAQKYCEENQRQYGQASLLEVKRVIFEEDR